MAPQLAIRNLLHCHQSTITNSQSSTIIDHYQHVIINSQSSAICRLSRTRNHQIEVVHSNSHHNTTQRHPITFHHPRTLGAHNHWPQKVLHQFGQDSCALAEQTRARSKNSPSEQFESFVAQIDELGNTVDVVVDSVVVVDGDVGTELAAGVVAVAVSTVLAFRLFFAVRRCSLVDRLVVVDGEQSEVVENLLTA
jgi:hypothetical protein